MIGRVVVTLSYPNPMQLWMTIPVEPDADKSTVLFGAAVRVADPLRHDSEDGGPDRSGS